MDAQKIVQTFSLCFNAVPNFLYAPAFLESSMELELYHKTENYKSIAQCWKNIDLAIIKIDNYPTSPDLGTAARYEVLLKESMPAAAFSPIIITCREKLSGPILITVYRFQSNIWLHAKRLSVYVHQMSCQKVFSEPNTGLFTHIIASQPLLEAVLEA